MSSSQISGSLLEENLPLHKVVPFRRVSRAEARQLWKSRAIGGLFNLPDERLFDACQDFCLQGTQVRTVGQCTRRSRAHVVVWRQHEIEAVRAAEEHDCQTRGCEPATCHKAALAALERRTRASIEHERHAQAMREQRDKARERNRQLEQNSKEMRKRSVEQQQAMARLRYDSAMSHRAC